MDQLPPEAHLMQIIMGQITSSAACALAKLGIPDHLESGPKTAAELGALVNAKPDLLERLMRTTASLGILSCTDDGKWTQTPMSAALRTHSTKTLGDLAVFFGDDVHARGFASLEETVRSGEIATERLFGLPLFEYYRANPEAGEVFNRAMTGFSTQDAPAVVEACDFSGIGALVDVAGGYGLMLGTILERYPNMRGTLYELPQVMEHLEPQWSPAVADRIQLLQGDMFESVPPGADAYMMKRILHDWMDEDCIKILKNCRAGVCDGGKLIVIDAVVPDGPEFSPAKLMDLTMMVFVGGKERTEQEFGDLFAASGWRLNRIVPTRSQLSVVEGIPA